MKRFTMVARITLTAAAIGTLTAAHVWGCDDAKNAHAATTVGAARAKAAARAIRATRATTSPLIWMTASPAWAEAAGEGTPAPVTPPVAPTPPDTPSEPYMRAMRLAPRAATVFPRGWFGFSFQCEECTTELSSGDTTTVWRFVSVPEVQSVEPGSPAARAGFQRGDVLTHIDGVSLLSPDGGRRFGSFKPGQVVRWTVLRDGTPRVVVVRAGMRPEAIEAQEFRGLRDQLSELKKLSDVDRIRSEVARLNAQIEKLAVEQTRRARATTPGQHRLRYAGTVGGADVEVRGAASVVVTEGDQPGELVITTGDAVVRIRAQQIAKESPGRRRPDGP